MLFGHIRRNSSHLKLAGGAACQMKRKGVYAWGKRCILNIEFVCVCVCGRAAVWFGRNVAVCARRVFICMRLLTAGSVPGPAHLLASQNWWHHRNSMTRLFLVAAAIAAVTVAMGRPRSFSLFPFHAHTLRLAWLRSQFLTIVTAERYGCQNVDRNNCWDGRSGF